MMQRAVLLGVAALGVFLSACGSDALQHPGDPKDGPDALWLDQDSDSTSSDELLGAASVDENGDVVVDVVDEEVQEEADAVPVDGDPADGVDDQEAGEGANTGGDGDPPAPSRVIVKFRPGSTASDRAALHRANHLTVDRAIPQLQVHAVKIPPGKAAEDVVARYERHPLVEYVELEQYAPAALIPNDPWFTYNPIPQWHLHNTGVVGVADADIDAAEAWDITTGSPDVVIAILDTGVYGGHEDLRTQMVPGRNTFLDTNDTSDFAGHGTLVAGAAAAASNNGIGVASVAWGCKVMPVVVSDTGWTGSVSLAEGVTWAADHGARIANMSWEIHGTSVLTDAAQYMHDRGGVVVQSAGNSGTFSSSSGDPNILKISGTNWNDEITSFSVTGNDIDLAAPASNILTTNVVGGVALATGTSVAAPIVSGVAALVYSVNPNLSGQDVQQILKDSADDLGPRGWDTGYGWGRVNAARAVQMALDYDSTPDETAPTVAIVNPVPGSVLSGLADVVATADDDTSVAQVDLYDDDVLVSSDRVPPHEWTIDTSGMPNGEHFLRAIAHDAAGNAGMSARVQVTVDNSVPCDCPPDCSEPANSETPGGSCTDGLDNDCDGVVDCDDPDCDSDAACFMPGCGNGACEADENVCSCSEDCGSAPSAESSCENGVDDDCDGAVDCADADCTSDAACSVEPCGDGACDSASGENACTCPADCGSPRATERKCSDHTDDDCDGAVDCADSDCASDAACSVEPCGDGVCDSASGEDGCTCPEDCGSPPSSERKCTDGMDDDCDGYADGDDPDCIAASGCGNGVCEGDGEDCFTCPEDCGCRGNGCKACCGDGACKGPGENKNTCPVDCAK